MTKMNEKIKEEIKIYKLLLSFDCIAIAFFAFWSNEFFEKPAESNAFYLSLFFCFFFILAIIPLYKKITILIEKLKINF